MNASRRVLRAFEPADMDGVADLWVAAWKTTGLPIDFDARREWLVARLAQLAQEGAAILVGLDADGRLLMRTAGALETVEAADVFFTPSCEGAGDEPA